MNRFDNEDKIISQFQEVNDNEVMFATQSETIEAVYPQFIQKPYGKTG